MKPSILILIFTFSLINLVCAQEFKVITTIESLWMAGGKSRILDHPDPEQMPTTIESVEGKKDEELSIKKFDETKLLNLYSMRDIATNDAVMSAKLASMAKDGWVLVFVNTGVRGVADNGGRDVLITRYIFRKD